MDRVPPAPTAGPARPAVPSARSGPPSGPLEWQLLSQRPGPAGYVTVVTNTYRLPHGTTADWDILTGPDVVSVLALTHDEDVVLARQYRPGPGAVLDELPGGYLDPGEDPAAGAARELLEETGYRGTVEVVGHTYLSGNATRRRYAAVATGCVRVAEPDLDPGERCEPVTVSLAELRRRLRAGRMTDLALAYLCLDALGLL